MKKFTLIFCSLLIYAISVRAQALYQPYSYDFYQKFNADLYSTKTRLHTSQLPLIIDSVLRQRYDSLMNVGVDSTRRRSWVHRILFDQHLIDVKNKEFTFFADYLPDLVVGRDFSGKKTVNLNTRGFQAGGTIGNKFYFYTSMFENQGKFPGYYDTYVNQTGTVSGQAYDRNGILGFTGKMGPTKDWSYVTAVVSYTPIKYVNFTLGNDKTFIGDGYRSILLSDFAQPYPFLKVTFNLGNVRYMAMWSQMIDPTAPKFSYENGNRKKWGAFHYLDWNVSNRFSVGFFDAVVWADKDPNGIHRGFDFSYLNPFQFMRPVEASVGSPDNAFIGITSKYKIADGAAIYGQFGLDEFEAKNFFSSNGSNRNKFAFQVGMRGADLFGVKSLNYLVEYNTARPFTYSEQNQLTNYAHQNEPLAHPFGANFREAVALLNYSYKKFQFFGEVDFGRYGLDINGVNFGKDPFKNYPTAARPTGNYIGQGLTTNMYYLEGRAAYLLNPKYNLRIELGGTLRHETNSAWTDKTAMITIGLRSSFRNLYTDLASYRNR